MNSTKFSQFFSSKATVKFVLATAVISGLTLSLNHQALAKTEVTEDQLNTEKSLRWGGEGLPFNEVVTVRDSLVNSVVGKLVIDRHGEDIGAADNSGLLSGLFNAVAIRNPFIGPSPGRMTIVTMWGSKEEGCFVKAMIHDAPRSGGTNFVPVRMEVGIGTQVIKLTPVSKSTPSTASGKYTYSDGQIERTSSMFFSANTFAVNAKVADLLRNAPAGNAKVRITSQSGDTKVFEIGAKNVAQWRDSYGYNANCQARN
jgi:hypothetical protein